MIMEQVLIFWDCHQQVSIILLGLALVLVGGLMVIPQRQLI